MTKLSDKEISKLKSRLEPISKDLETNRNLLKTGFNAGLYSHFSKLNSDLNQLSSDLDINDFQSLSKSNLKKLSKRTTSLIKDSNNLNDLFKTWQTQSYNVASKTADLLLNDINKNNNAFQKQVSPPSISDEINFQKQYFTDKINDYAIAENTLNENATLENDTKTRGYSSLFEDILNRSIPLMSTMMINRWINNSLYDNFQYNDIPYKLWLSQHDQYVRPTHRVVDGEVVELNERFSNGCLYPCDSTAELSEIINCRCYMVPTLQI